MRMIGLVTLLLPGIAAPDLLDEFIELRTGSFSSAMQASQDARYETARLAELGPGDLQELDGCAMTLTRAGTGRFEGSTFGNRCPNGYKGASYAISRSVIAGDTCDKSVRMLVYGEIEDRTAFGAYGRAVAESGLYARANAYYEAMTPPLEVFEGEPPPERGVIIARFPCIEAAREFWHSDIYADIRPLRDGIARFEVLLLPVPPIPSYYRD